jgi:ATP-dependent RNA helicase DDX35
VFLIDGGDSVKGELERRKFTAEEGDHLTALNAYNAFVKCALFHSSRLILTHTLALQTAASPRNGATPFVLAFVPFLLWISQLTYMRLLQHRLNFKALSRALSIRTQLRKYIQRFEIPIVSCGEDHSKIRRCLTSGFFRNAARVMPDGTYRSVRENAVSLLVPVRSRAEADARAQILHVHPSSVLFTRTPTTPFVIYHEVIESEFCLWSFALCR